MPVGTCSKNKNGKEQRSNKEIEYPRPKCGSKIDSYKHLCHMFFMLKDNISVVHKNARRKLRAGFQKKKRTCARAILLWLLTTCHDQSFLFWQPARYPSSTAIRQRSIILRPDEIDDEVKTRVFIQECQILAKYFKCLISSATCIPEKTKVDALTGLIFR